MSELPQVFEPDPYSVALPERLTHVFAASVCAMLFGLLGLVTLPFQVEPAWSTFLGYRGGSYATHSPIETWGVIVPTISVGLCVIALAGGIGAMRFFPVARLALLGFGIIEVLKGLAGIWFHVKIIQLATSGHPIPDFGYNVAAIAEWPDWAFGTILGAYVVWVMLQPSVKAAFARGHAV